jgi:hypothetical protein
VSNWILYDDFVDLVRDLHHSAYSGLITGVSDDNHSFQIGFDQGAIILLTYRIRKGLAALQLITQIGRAKITEHPNSDIHEAAGEDLDTHEVLAQLTANTLDETTTVITSITDVPTLPQTGRTSSLSSMDAKLKRLIQTAAIHHFGPIGAMVCDDHLGDPQGDVRAIVFSIARDVGASEADTEAFLRTVSNG